MLLKNRVKQTIFCKKWGTSKLGRRRGILFVVCQRHKIKSHNFPLFQQRTKSGKNSAIKIVYNGG